ncbi:MAG: hypothetical protein AAF700_06305 [Pseudomonadota bacterium]
MPDRQGEQRPITDSRDDGACWREALYGAFAGPFAIDYLLEKYIDHLERTP